jgi:hypothetical protein
MRRFTTTAIMSGLLSACFAPGVRADGWNKETHVTTNVPLQVQNTVLAPGEYVFKMIGGQSNTGVVGVFNITARGARLETTMIALPAYRENAGDSKLLMISDRQGDEPVIVKYWFYPGDNFGIEFQPSTKASETAHAHRINSKRQKAAKTDPVAASAGN